MWNVGFAHEVREGRNRRLEEGWVCGGDGWKSETRRDVPRGGMRHVESRTRQSGSGSCWHTGLKRYATERFHRSSGMNGISLRSS